RLILEAGRLDEAARHVVRFAPPIEIPVRVGARTFGCSVDTGSTLTMHLPLSVAGELVAGELSGGEAGRRANTRFSLRRGRLADEVRFADNQVPDVVARFSDRARGVNLGAGVLSRFAVSVDPRSRLLRIAPTPPRRSGPEAALLPR
ncbi:MAG: hypothetical protein KAI24_07180, partial [Planctomycetes bacterium]|nr:hypothetical protein [Planctomycetota bacterium]